MSRLSTALIGRAGEMMVAAELMRRGVEIAHPASDVGVDLLAYRLDVGERTTRKFVPIQVKTYSGDGYQFHKSWFRHAPDLALVVINSLATDPCFYVFRDISDVEAAIGNHALTESWTLRGKWTATTPSRADVALLLPHRSRWERITEQLPSSNLQAS